MNERVSDENLEVLRQWCAGWVEEGISSEFGYWSRLASLLTELQSLRQTSVAGVEEAAERMCLAWMNKRNSEGTIHVGTLEAMTSHFAAELAALLAERDAVIDELRNRVAERCVRIKELNKHLLDATQCVHDQATAIAERDALLRECRDVVWGEAVNARMHSDPQGVYEMKELLDRIDAILGKEVDGGSN